MALFIKSRPLVFCKESPSQALARVTAKSSEGGKQITSYELRQLAVELRRYEQGVKKGTIHFNSDASWNHEERAMKEIRRLEEIKKSSADVADSGDGFPQNAVAFGLEDAGSPIGPSGVLPIAGLIALVAGILLLEAIRNKPGCCGE